MKSPRKTYKKLNSIRIRGESISRQGNRSRQSNNMKMQSNSHPIRHYGLPFTPISPFV